MPNQYSEVVAREIRLILPYDDPKLAYVRSRQAPTLARSSPYAVRYIGG
jgi:hypothetical protein